MNINKNIKKFNSISTVICTKERVEDLEKCLQTIVEQKLTPHEIIIVDSSTSDDTKNLINEFKNRLPAISYIHTKPGLTRQRNIGIKQCSGDIIAFIDDDVLLDKMYFAEILKGFNSFDDVAGVGGCLINESRDSSFVRSMKKIFLHTTYDGHRGYMQKSGLAKFPYNGHDNKIADTQILVGCSCAYEKNVFKYETFDEYFQGYAAMEDVEFSYRVAKKRRLLFTPYAKLEHKKSMVSRDNLEKKFIMLVVNHYYVFKKLVQKSSFDWVCFWWSDIGSLMESFFWTFKSKSISPVAGIIKGHKQILNMIKNP